MGESQLDRMLSEECMELAVLSGSGAVSFAVY